MKINRAMKNLAIAGILLWILFAGLMLGTTITLIAETVGIWDSTHAAAETVDE